jgi:hypothetical protein
VSTDQLLKLAGATVAVLALAIAPVRAAADVADGDPSPILPSGSLTQPGELSGTAEVDFLVNPSGTYTATISVDGTIVVSDPVSQGSGHLALDTTTLQDGSHSVLVSVGDGDTTDTVWSGTIETHNAPQGGIPTIAGTTEVGESLNATPGSWSPAAGTITYQWQRCDATGASCAPITGAVGQSYQLTAADTNAEVEVEVWASDASGSTLATSALTSVVLAAGEDPSGGGGGASVANGPNGTGACSAAHLTAAFGTSTTQTILFGAHATLHGALSCAGSPIAGATLNLSLARTSGSGAAVQAHIETGSDGSFSYLVPSGPSRTLTLSYHAFSQTTPPSASATLELRVRPQVTLRITPTSTTNGHTIRFTGRVSGGFIGRSGLPLDIEYREGDQWLVYTQVRADSRTGRFSWRYTFERTTESITYSFRVAIPASGVAGYPYAPAASAVRSVHVDP